MKRLILLSMMFMFHMTYTEDTLAAQTSTDQSPSYDTSSASPEEVSVSVANLHQIDLDNTDIDSGGNWLNKRIWYERAQATFDEIRVLVNTVSDLRIQFANEVNAVGQKIDSFYESVTFTRTDLDDKFKEMLAALDAEQRIVGDLSEEERNLQTSLKQVLPTIDQIGKDIKSIGEVDNKIDQTIMQAFKTIDEGRQFETKAWEAFKAIAKELDDKKARNLYYQMNNYKQNIEQKLQYLQSTLLPYLHNVLVARIDMNISKINSSIEDLKKKGVDLEKIMDKTREDDATQIKEREKIAADLAVQKALEEQQVKDNAEQEKLQKELDLAKKNSFSNVVNVYYQATIGKITGFLSGILALFGLDNLLGSLMSMPQGSAKKNELVEKSAKGYGAQLFDRILGYFGFATTSKVQTKKAQEDEKISEKVVEKVATQEADTKKLQEDKQGEPSSVVIPEKIATSEQAGESEKVADSSAQTSSEHVNDEKIEETLSTTPVAEEHKEVVVQAMREDDYKKDALEVSQSYVVFKNILDMVGTIIVSLYNCIVQFVKMILSIIVYISSVN